MTNKEAATILNSIKAFFSDENGKSVSDGYTALDKAVELLEQIPDEHGDLVNADTVLWEVLDSEGIVPPMPVTIGDVIEGYDVPIVIAAERKYDGK